MWLLCVKFGFHFLTFLTVLKYVTQDLWPSVFPKHKLYVWSTCMYKESGFGPFKLDSVILNVHVLGLPVWKTIAVLQEPEEPWNATKPSLFVEHSGAGEMNTLSLLKCLTLITAFTKFLFCLWSLYFFGAFSVIYPNQVHTWAQLSLGFVFFFPT